MGDGFGREIYMRNLTINDTENIAAAEGDEDDLAGEKRRIR